MTKKLLFSVTLKDCEVQTFRVGGNGGQKVNKTSSGVRIIHRPSGARAECTDTRSQYENKKRAFHKMAESGAFKVWLNSRLAEKTPEERVAEDMDPANLLVEYRGPTGWEPVDG